MCFNFHMATNETFDQIIKLGETVDRMKARAAFVPRGRSEDAFNVSYAADKARYHAAMAALTDDELAAFVAYYKARRA